MTKNKSWAIIDIGTNTVSMIIAQKTEKKAIEVLAETEFPVFIGHEGLKNKIITVEGIARLQEAFTHCKKIWEDYQIPLTQVRGVATSAIRNAQNGNAVMQQIFEDFGVEVDIISGEQEAEYIYLGVRESLQFSDRTVLIMDIGGGSVECILGNENQIFWKKSIELGVQRIKDMFGKHDPMTDIEIQNLDFYLELQFAPLTKILQHYVPEFLAGSAGCFDTLAYMHLNMEETEKEIKTKINGCKIRTEDFYSIYQKVINAPLADRQTMRGMVHRAEMMPFAISLVKFVLQKSEVTEIQVSNFSLREGYFLGKEF